MLAHSCEMLATCHFYLFVVFETCCVILRCISIWYEFIFWEYDRLFLIFMLILSLLRNGIGIFNQNYINMHLKNVKILTEGRWHCIVKKVMQLNMFKAEIFPRLSYSLNTTPGTLNFPSIPSEGGMFLYFLQCLWSLFIQNINVFRYLHSGGFIWWIPHAHFLNCLRLKFIPCVIADWAPDYWGTDVWEIFIPRWEDDSYWIYMPFLSCSWRMGQFSNVWFSVILLLCPG